QAETTLAKTVADIPDGVADELILVDDASTDGTAALSRGLGIATYVHERNRGYGGNQKTCYLRALEPRRVRAGDGCARPPRASLASGGGAPAPAAANGRADGAALRAVRESVD